MRRLLLLVLLLLPLTVALALAESPKRVGPEPKTDGWVSLSPRSATPHLLQHPRQLPPQAADVVDWSVIGVGAKVAWKNGLTGKGVKVCGIDTGVDGNHKDLTGAILKSKDFTGSKYGSIDVNGHGTHTAGTVAARKNGWGLTGVAYECDLLNAKALNDGGAGKVEWVRDALDWAVTEEVDVVFMSFGGEKEAVIEAAVKKAHAAGVILIAAAGNGNGAAVEFPAAYPECFAVAALTEKGKLADFSNDGPEVKAYAPGVNVRSLYPGAGDGLFATFDGTSMAAPVTAGVAALWVQWDMKSGGDRKTRPARFDTWLKVGKYKVPRADWIGAKPTNRE